MNNYVECTNCQAENIWNDSSYLKCWKCGETFHIEEYIPPKVQKIHAKPKKKIKVSYVRIDDLSFNAVLKLVLFNWIIGFIAFIILGLIFGLFVL